MQTEVSPRRYLALARRIGQAAACAAALSTLVAPAAIAGPTYMTGHISNVTYVSDFVMIMLDTGLPDNCAGTSYGWMRIPPENKAMSAYVIGLSLSGNAPQTLVSVYTSAVVNGGYCQVTQIDPAG